MSHWKCRVGFLQLTFHMNKVLNIWSKSQQLPYVIRQIFDPLWSKLSADFSSMK